jgi:sulfonate transport system substrate-binding protein
MTSMLPGRRLRRLSLLVSCVALPLAAAEAPLRVHGNTSTIELAPVLLAAQAQGVSATVASGGVPDLAKPGVPKPDVADLATNAETQALRASVDNPDLRIILTVCEGLYRVVGRRSAGINSLADLKGKRVATIGVTSSGYFLHRMLRTAGLDIADVTVVSISPLSKMSDAIANHEVDAVTIWEPEMDDVARTLGADAIEFSGAGIYRELFNLHATRAELADPAERARIVAFVREVIRASKALQKDPAAAQAAVVKSAGYSPEVVARTWQHHRYPGNLVPDLLDVLEDEEHYVARERNREPRPRSDLARLIDASILTEALAGHPELRMP